MSEIDFFVDSGKLALGRFSKLMSIFLNSISELSSSKISLNNAFSSFASTGNPIFISALFLQFLLFFVIRSSEITFHASKSFTAVPGGLVIFETSSLILSFNRLKNLVLSIFSASTLRASR